MSATDASPLRSTIPTRLDRLRWTPFHTRMVAGLGAAWILDGGSSRGGLVVGYVIGGAIMALGGIVELLFGVKSEGQSLETVTKPLTAVSG